jgi:hypothetical protein
VKELDDVYHLPGMLTPAEVDCLFQLGQFTLALHAIYIASRKSRIPHSKTVGRKLLRRCTRQTWLPVILFVFCANIAR